KLNPEEDQRRLARCLAWTESKNLYAGVLLRFRAHDGKFADRITDLKDWQVYWGLTDTGSQLGRLRFQGGNVKARKLSAPDRLTAEDFRLHKDSDGKGAGEGGRDLGADVDQVGPGKAYEAWKKTAAYDTWLAATGQSTPFVVLAAVDRTELKFSNLA